MSEINEFKVLKIADISSSAQLYKFKHFRHCIEPNKIARPTLSLFMSIKISGQKFLNYVQFSPISDFEAPELWNGRPGGKMPLSKTSWYDKQESIQETWPVIGKQINRRELYKTSTKFIAYFSWRYLWCWYYLSGQSTFI